VLDGSGAAAVDADVAVAGDRITFVGDAAAAGLQARDTLDVSGMLVTPGFIDMHSHAELDQDYGRPGKAFLFQGITSVASEIDGGGDAGVAAHLAEWARNGIGVNAFLYVGRNAARREAMGMEARAPSPGEVIELNRVAAAYPGAIYDTHRRGFGAFTKKLKDFALDDTVISVPFAVRSMTGLAADFMGWKDRGYLREGYAADITVLDLPRVLDLATYENPKQYSEGTVHVLVNGVFAIRDGEATGALGGRPLVRGGAVFKPAG
jgi:N-acyl-D-aspartate/D-glutamate deacylase